jgi:DNA mismatch repair ATPase MutS
MVPAAQAGYPAFDQIFTHFATEESMETGAGKLKEELQRLKALMDRVTNNSFVIINEIFTSATSYDGYIMGKKVLDFFMEKDCLGVYVTHIYELTKEDDRIASLVASLLSEDSNVRTFKIERRKADGKSYANTIVEKYHMTYEEIKERIKQ